MSILSSVALGWLGRRVLDWGGIAIGGTFGLIQFYNNMPPPLQVLVQKVATGHWQEITLGAVPGLLVWGWSQFQSFKTTTRPQVVTDEGKRVEMDKLAPAAQQTVNATVRSAPKTILDALIDKLNRNR